MIFSLGRLVWIFFLTWKQAINPHHLFAGWYNFSQWNFHGIRYRRTATLLLDFILQWVELIPDFPCKINSLDNKNKRSEEIHQLQMLGHIHGSDYDSIIFD